MENNVTPQTGEVVKENDSLITEEKPYFVKGGKAGPGRPKGSLSLTSKIRQILEDNPEQLASIIKAIFEKHPDLVWKMVDGLPRQTTELQGNVEIKWQK